MKTRRKKILSVLLALGLLLSMVPAAVLADGPAPLTGNETVLDLSRLTGEDVGGFWDGKWYYNASDGLIGIRGTDDNGAFTITGEPAPGIALKGIEAGEGIDLIFDRAELTLAGGTGWALQVGANGSGGSSPGGSLTLRGSALTVGGAGYGYAVRTGTAGGGGVPANQVDVTLERSRLTATGGGTDEAVYVFGDLTVGKGSTLRADQAGTAVSNADIRVEGEMAVNGGTVSTSSGKNRGFGILVQAGGALTVTSGGAVTVPSSAGSGWSGIHVEEGGMRVEGGSSVRVTETGAGSAGIVLSGDVGVGRLTVVNSSLEAAGAEFGISLSGALSVTHADVTARGTAPAGTGLSGGMGSTIDGLSEVTLAGGSGGYALDTLSGSTGNNDFTVNGGTVTLEGNVDWSGSYGGNLVINGGSVQITGASDPRPQNTAGTALYKTEVTLPGAGAGLTVGGSVTTTPSAIEYPLAGARTDEEERVYVWLPVGTATAGLEVLGARSRQSHSGDWMVTTADTAAVTLTSSHLFSSESSVVVTGGTCSGELLRREYYAEGELITLTADPAPSGQVFKEWLITPYNPVPVPITPVRGTWQTPVVKFLMPGTLVYAVATYEDDPSIIYKAELTPAGVTFPAAAAGYGVQASQSFIVDNTGTGELRDIEVSLSGAAFEQVEGAAGTLNPGEATEVTVRPRTGLAAGTYTGTLTVSMNPQVSLTAALSFTVNPAAGGDDDDDGDDSGGSGPAGGSNGSSGGGSGTPAPAPAQPGQLRVSGKDRYDTAAAIAGAWFAGGSDVVLLARGDSPVDALPAVPLAGLYKAPLLLTGAEKLPAETLDAIHRLGAQKVVLIGGPAAISEETEKHLQAQGLSVERIAGTDRYDTAYAIAKRLGSASGQAVIVNGDRCAETFADALSISAWAGSRGVPILYGDSSRTTLPEATAQALEELKVNRTLLIGGTGALPAALESRLPAPRRYGGENRYATNAQILRELQPDAETIYAADGRSFADALAGAAVAARHKGGLILTGADTASGLTSGQESLLRERKDTTKALYVFGGEGAVPAATLEALKELLGR